MSVDGCDVLHRVILIDRLETGINQALIFLLAIADAVQSSLTVVDLEHQRNVGHLGGLHKKGKMQQAWTGAQRALEKVPSFALIMIFHLKAVIEPLVRIILDVKYLAVVLHQGIFRDADPGLVG